MLHLSKQEGYWLYSEQTDMRKGFDSLHGIVKNEMGKDVIAGGVFIFINKRRNQIKLLHWESDGLSLYHKRLENGTYETPKITISTKSIQMSSEQLQYILSGIVLNSIKKRKRYRYTGIIHDDKTLYNQT
ncbi:MAG: IS66 family insertion sequence element accessory protein TnpB [Saprospiraceae bacterium]|nr:IS66 family insertion sequence element accessory protein TnpB [Saprospiraceae bacterium]